MTAIPKYHRYLVTMNGSTQRLEKGGVLFTLDSSYMRDADKVVGVSRDGVETVLKNRQGV